MVHAKGCDIASPNTLMIPDAVKAASGADATIILVGITQSQESEGHDRTSIDLPGVQHEMVSKVAAAAAAKGKPVMLVVMGGGMVDIEAEKNDPNVNAILFVGYPGACVYTLCISCGFVDSFWHWHWHWHWHLALALALALALGIGIGAWHLARLSFFLCFGQTSLRFTYSTWVTCHYCICTHTHTHTHTHARKQTPPSSIFRLSRVCFCRCCCCCCCVCCRTIWRHCHR